MASPAATGPTISSEGQTRRNHTGPDQPGPDQQGLAWDRALRVAQEVLADQSPSAKQTFTLRLKKWWPDLVQALNSVYPDESAAATALRLVRLAATAYLVREPELHLLDEERTLSPDWFQSSAMLGYAAYTERFAGELAGVGEKIAYLQDLGVNYLHLMPLLKPREGDSDGGYAVADYRTVRPDLGTIDDLRALATNLRHQRISLVMDLVLNHVAAEHEWARAAVAGAEKYRDYFLLFDNRSDVDDFEQTLPEVFPDFAPGNFTWSEELRTWVWTTFNSFQWDVNWANPDVLCEYADIVLYLANLGVEVLRLDAIAFMWKRLGTNCQNQPEVHALTQALRTVARIACPAVVFKAEAIVGPADLVQYLGQGKHHGKVSDIAYHNSLMVQIWSMFAAQDVRLGAIALSNLPATPTTTSWVTYLRCHDDIGWAIDDTDAWRAGLNGHRHRAFLSSFYSGEFPGSDSRGLVFQYNEATGDKRISGMAASLIGIEAAFESRDAERLKLTVDKLILAHAVIMGWGGIPVIWMGDEIGQFNDPDWSLEAGHEGDNRWAHRPKMDWPAAGQRTESGLLPSEIFGPLKHLAATRSSLPHLHASVAAQVITIHDPGVLPVLRQHPLGALLGLYNFTAGWRPYPVSELAALGLANGIDAITGEAMNRGQDDNIWLPPYGFCWIRRT